MIAGEETVFRFVVFGRPQGKGSKRVLPVRSTGVAGERRIVLVDDNRNAKPWAQQVALSALGALGVEQGATFALIRGPVAVTLDFHFGRPKSHYGTGRNAGTLKSSAPQWMIAMPDLDKLARNALDALTGVVIKDDAQIVRLHVAKFFGEPERLEVVLRAVQ